MLCQDCDKRDRCTELCKEAEEYANQDYVCQKELTIGLPKLKEPLELFSNVYLTKREKEIVTLLGRGLNRADVCQVLNITRSALRINIYRLRKKCNAFYY